MKLEALSIDALAALPERERRLLAIGAVAAALLLLFGVLLPLDHSVAQTSTRLAKKRADLSWMQSVTPELVSAAPLANPNGESLLVVIDRSAREAGIASTLTTEPAGAGSVSVRLQKAPFDGLIAWLGRLAQQNGVSVESATFEKGEAPGLVNAALVLHSG